LRGPSGTPRFRVALSIEKDPVARETLRLRAFFRQFPPSARPEQRGSGIRDEGYGMALPAHRRSSLILYLSSLRLRVHLDRESLRILAVHRPAVFVMENVRGILSARLGDKPVISQIP
jgi:site-specific DNA-cytosine methylase